MQDRRRVKLILTVVSLLAGLAVGLILFRLLGNADASSVPEGAARLFVSRPNTYELQELIRSADKIEIRPHNQPGFEPSSVITVREKDGIDSIADKAILSKRMQTPYPDVKWGMKSIYQINLIQNEAHFAKLTLRGFTGLDAYVLRSDNSGEVKFLGELETRELADHIFELKPDSPD